MDFLFLIGIIMFHKVSMVGPVSSTHKMIFEAIVPLVLELWTLMNKSKWGWIP